MQQQDNTHQLPPPNFLFEGIVLGVKSALRTHRFLCDVFAQSNTFISWDPLINYKGELPQLSQDGTQTVFQMTNTWIQFETATSPQDPVEQQKTKIGVKVQDVAHVKEVLDEHECNYKSGRLEEVPGRPMWIEFKDLDGYLWHVSEIVRN